MRVQWKRKETMGRKQWKTPACSPAVQPIRGPFSDTGRQGSALLVYRGWREHLRLWDAAFIVKICLVKNICFDEYWSTWIEDSAKYLRRQSLCQKASKHSDRWKLRNCPRQPWRKGLGKMEVRKSADNVVSAKLLEEKDPKENPVQSELTLPEKLCRFYVERPKLAFGEYFTFINIPVNYQFEFLWILSEN